MRLPPLAPANAWFSIRGGVSRTVVQPRGVPATQVGKFLREGRSRGPSLAAMDEGCGDVQQGPGKVAEGIVASEPR